MQRRWKNTVLFVLATLALAAGLWLNLPAKLSENGVANFDWHSNDIMISDLIYRQNYGTDSLFLQQITPGTLSPEDRSKAEGVQQQVFAQGGSFDRTLFQTYNSNVVVQRYQYAALDALLPVSNGTLLVILQGLNCLLFAAMLAILLNWIRGITGGMDRCPYGCCFGRCIALLCHVRQKPVLVRRDAVPADGRDGAAYGQPALPGCSGEAAVSAAGSGRVRDLPCKTTVLL